MPYESNSEQETAAIAARMAATLKARDVVCLHGDLGMGKSVFARAVIRALSGNEALEVPSPTFTLVQTYETPRGAVWHFDLYRLKDPDEIFELGWEEALADGIVIVEWPERLGHHLPKQCINIRMTGQDDLRSIEIT
jgi:tRNA threonylcarbamoyladenosine biosynthesis protein TsaE